MPVRVTSAVPSWPVREALVRRFLASAGPEESVFVTSYLDDALPVLHELCEDAMADVEAVTFPSLVTRVREAAGGPTRSIATSATIRRTVPLAAEAVLDEDCPLRRLCGTDRAVRRIVAALGELHASGWTGDALAELPGDGLMVDWARRLGRLDAELGRRLAMKGRGRHHEALRTDDLETLSLDHAFARLLVFTDGETHPGRDAFLAWLGERGTEVVVVTERHAVDAPLFAPSRETEATLGDPIRVGSGENLLRTLFTAESPDGSQAEERIAPTLARECEWALRCAIQDKGAILARNLDRYAAPLLAASRELGIAVSVSCSVELSAVGLPNAIERLLALAERPTMREWRSVLHSGVLGLPPDTRLIAKKWTESGESAAELPELLAGDPPAQTRIAALVEWIADAEPKSWDDWHHRLLKLVAEVLHVGVGPEPATAVRDGHVGSAIQRELAAALSFTAADETVDIGRFRDLVREALADARATIPTSPEGIRVACEPAAIGPAPVVHVLGASEGTYPRPRRDDPLLPDELRAILNAARPEGPWLPLAADVAERERDAFYRACASAPKLVFWRPEREGDSPSLPSPYVGLATATPRHRSEAAVAWPAIPDPDDLYATDRDRVLRAALDAEAVPRGEIGLTDDDARAKIRDEEPRLTWPMLQDAVACDLRYAFRHRLGIRGSRESDRFSWRSAVRAVATEPDGSPERLREVALAALGRSSRTGSTWARAIADLHALSVTENLVRRETEARLHWARQPIGLAEFGGEHLKGRVSVVPMEGPFVPVSRTERGDWIVHVPATVDGPNDIGEDDHLVLAVAMWALRRRPGERVFAEVESPRKGRFLMRFEGPDPFRRFLSKSLATGTFRFADGDGAEREFAAGYADTFRRVHRIAVSGDAVPRPGRGCAICDLGEICRRHAGFSDVPAEDPPL